MTKRKKKPVKGAAGRLRESVRAHYPLLVGVVAVILAAVWLFYPIYQVRMNQEQQLASVRREYARVRAENRSLRKRIAEIKSPEYIERYAREKLGLIKPGETAYVVLPPNRSVSPSQTPTRSIEPTRSVEATGTWDRIRAFFSELLTR